jgi:hypothetical protein
MKIFFFSWKEKVFFNRRRSSSSGKRKSSSERRKSSSGGSRRTGPKALEPWDQGAGPHPAKHGKESFFASSMDAIYPQLSLRTQTHAL